MENKQINEKPSTDSNETKNIINKYYNYFHYSILALIFTHLFIRLYFLITTFSDTSESFLIGYVLYILITIAILVGVIKKQILSGYGFSTIFFADLSYNFLNNLNADSSIIYKINLFVCILTALLSLLIWWKVYNFKFTLNKSPKLNSK